MANKKSTASRSTGAKKVAAKKARPSARKKTTVAKKTAVAKRPAAKKTVVKKSVAKKTAKRPVAKKTQPKKKVAKAVKKEKKSEKKSIFARFKKFMLPFAALVIIAFVVLAVTGNLGSLNFNFLSSKEQVNTESLVLIEAGDTVSVDYIGTFTDGEVFDTSYEQVARDNELYQEGRPYDPLGFEVGAGQMIKGFDDAVVGMAIGEEKTVTLAPEDAYGPSNPEMIIEMPTSIDRIVYLDREFNITLADFTQVFAEDPVVDAIVGSEAFPWNFSVKSVSGDDITLEYLIDVNDTIVLPQTIWDSTATAKNETTITLVQNPEDGSGIETIFGTGIISLTEDKIDISFDVAVGATVTTPYGQGTILDVTDESVTLDLNPPMVGKTLVFEITVVNITKADTNAIIIDSE